MSTTFSHQSVMESEVLSFFKDAHGKVLVDATAGGGGHLSLLAKAASMAGIVIAFDRDPRAHEDDAAGGVAKQYKNIRLFPLPFSHIQNTLQALDIEKIDGLVCDLGVSSYQLDAKDRGFSFLADAPIDMRMDPTTGISAYEWLAISSESTIADVLFTLGNERKSRSIARAIKQKWPIENSTLALAHLILSAIKQKKWSKIHPATRSFQALRMAVNHEVEELRCLLGVLPQILAVNGIAVFLSFHSVEDRIVKNAFKQLSRNKCESDDDPRFEILTKKPLMASKVEIDANRRARSAKLRAIKRIS